MTDQPAPVDILLQRVDRLGRELEQLKRDLLHSAAASQPQPDPKPSLFGSISGGDITDNMITRAQQRLFRSATEL
jgi:hypothetical protein